MPLLAPLATETTETNGEITFTGVYNGTAFKQTLIVSPPCLIFFNTVTNNFWTTTVITDATPDDVLYDTRLA